MRRISETRDNFSPPALAARNVVSIGDQVSCQEDGPKLLFKSLLDSGATNPSLYESDLSTLGISKDFYSAQSCVPCNTANGTVVKRVYELHVEVAGNEGSPIVDPQNPVNPLFPRYIGGLSAVIMDESTPDGYPFVNADGFEDSRRLSGIMPFLAPYVTITPSSNKLLLGENRNDVVGARKMPPHRRWMIGLDQYSTSTEGWDV